MKQLALNTKKTQALLEQFNSLKPGESINFPSPMPGMSGEQTTATLIRGSSTIWEFRLFWHGVELGVFSAHASKTKLTMEVL